MISQIIIVKGERFFKAADGSDVQMSESQGRHAMEALEA